MSHSLIAIAEKAIHYGLKDKLWEVLTAVDDTMSSHTFEHVVKLSEEIDEIISDIVKTPTAEEIEAKNPALCEGCEE